MSYIYILVYLIFTLSCATLTFGMELAYWRAKYPQTDFREDAAFAAEFALLTFVFPFLIVPVYLGTAFAKYGFKFTKNSL